MAATAAQIAQIRRMVNEPDTTAYTADMLKAIIEQYPLIDKLGQPPYIRSTTAPYTLIANVWWAPTYDLHAAAADVWEEKAAVLSAGYDFQADGSSFSRSQAYEQAMKQARFHRSRRSISTITMRPEPTDLSDLAYGDDDNDASN